MNNKNKLMEYIIYENLVMPSSQDPMLSVNAMIKVRKRTEKNNTDTTLVNSLVFAS